VNTCSAFENNGGKKRIIKERETRTKERKNKEQERRQEARKGNKIKRSGSHYEILGISKDACFVEINCAYRSEELCWHPDKCPDDDAKEYFDLVTAAYNVLVDKEARSAYDHALEHATGGTSEPVIDGKNDPSIDGKDDPSIDSDGKSEDVVDGENDPVVDLPTLGGEGEEEKRKELEVDLR